MRVYGKCQGYDIILYKEAGRWVTTVPATSTDLVIELFAEDDAGNTSYMASLLVYYDQDRLTMSIKITDVDCKCNMDVVKAFLKNDDAVMKVTVQKVDIGLKLQQIVMDVIGNELIRGD